MVQPAKTNLAPYTQQTYIIPANGFVRLVGDWDSFLLLSATNVNNLQIIFNNGGPQNITAGVVIGKLRDMNITEIVLADTSGAPNTVVVAQGAAELRAAGSLPLPSGAATAVLQTSGNALLTTISGKIPALGQAAMAASLPVVIASNQTVFPVKPYAAGANDWSYAAAAGGILNTVVAVTIKAAAAATIHNHITGMHLAWAALGAATEIAIRDGAGGTVLWRGYIAVGVAGDRFIDFPTPLRGSAATLLEFLTLTASVTGVVYINAQGYEGV